MTELSGTPRIDWYGIFSQQVGFESCFSNKLSERCISEGFSKMMVPKHTLNIQSLKHQNVACCVELSSCNALMKPKERRREESVSARVLGLEAS